MQKTAITGALALILTSPVSATLPAQVTSRAQAQMHNRIGVAVDEYASRIGVDNDLITYCRIQMSLDTRHEMDGSIPFGINYHAVENEDELATIIQIREAYERNYLILCLARAKAALNAADR